MWARTQNNLGTTYGSRIRGNRAENQELAIAAYSQALQVLTRETFPQDWARTQINLGNAYRKRISGERADNLEQAIAAYNGAIQVFTREHFPKAWAQIQNNLGNAYGDRIRGDRAETLRGCKMLVPQSDRPILAEDEYHVLDLIGLPVINQLTGETVGTVVDLVSAGHDLLVVNPEPKQPKQDAPASDSENQPFQPSEPKSKKPSKNSSQILIPFVKEIVPVVNLATGRIEIAPPPGLLDL